MGGRKDQIAPTYAFEIFHGGTLVWILLQTALQKSIKGGRPGNENAAQHVKTKCRRAVVRTTTNMRGHAIW